MDSKEPIENNLYSNPMVNSAKKALTPEQMEEYKRIGEYMYNNIEYKNAEIGPQVRESNDEDLILYATEAIKSGCDPNDLSEVELQALCKVYGDKWYERYGFEAHEVPKPIASFYTPEKIFAEAEKKAKSLKLNHKQRRMIERRINKDRKKIEENRK